MVSVTIIQREEKDHTTSNGHLPGRPVSSSSEKGSLGLLILSTLILVIGSLNYLQLKELRSVYETALDEQDETVSDEQSLKPRVWIQGKRVCNSFM